MIYGNHNLRRGDHDGTPANNRPPRWGGVDNPPPPTPANAQTPQNQGGATLAIPQHVRQLQQDLRTLGFMFVGTPDGGFGRGTEWAVREFQIYASMANAAQLNQGRLHGWQPQAGLTAPEVMALGLRPNSNPPESYHVASLDRVANGSRYTGPISGVMNANTRTAMEHWLRNNYRCPVVIEAWQVATGNNQRTTPYTNGINIWNFDEITQGTVRNASNRVVARVRMFSRDFTGHYTLPNGRRDDQYQSLGSYARFMTYGGPMSEVPNHTWAEAEMTPERLIGPGTTTAILAATPNGAAASTYRVVRATAEQECMGMFDSINAYDDALVSLGPCHWTMGLMPAGGYDNGELPGFLAYFLHRNQADYQRYLGNLGLYPATAWAGVNTGPLWDRTGRKYVGWIRHHDEQTQPPQAATGLAQLPMVDRATLEANYFKTWHWFYRLAMIGRTCANFQQAMWDMVRFRIRDIRSAPITVNVGAVHINGTLGDIYTSEKSVAILLRWHIFRPGHVTGARVRDSLTRAINGHAQLNWSTAPAQWTNAHEQAITAQLLTDALSVNDTQDRLANWPTYAGRNGRNYTLNNELGALRDGRGSFHFDTTGI